jgi:hypothetical protein
MVGYQFNQSVRRWVLDQLLYEDLSGTFVVLNEDIVDNRMMENRIKPLFFLFHQTFL